MYSSEPEGEVSDLNSNSPLTLPHNCTKQESVMNISKHLINEGKYVDLESKYTRAHQKLATHPFT